MGMDDGFELDVERVRDAGVAAGVATGELVRRERSRLGLSQVRFGELVGMSQAEVSRLERRGVMRVDTLYVVAEALGSTGPEVLKQAEGGCQDEQIVL